MSHSLPNNDNHKQHIPGTIIRALYAQFHLSSQ